MITMTDHEYCWDHQCYQCAAEEASATPPQRDAVNVLEARIADLEAENLDLRRRVSALEHLTQDLQRAHNAWLQAEVRDLAEDVIAHINRSISSRLS